MLKAPLSKTKDLQAASEKRAPAEKRSGESFRSPLRYPGGKQKAIAQIASVFPSDRIIEFREPMVGGANVYFHVRRNGIAQSYWLNDLFVELIAFWKQVAEQESCERLVQELHKLRSSFGKEENSQKYVDSARKVFERFRKQETSDDFQAALHFFFFNRVTFSGTTRAGGFSGAASMHRFTKTAIDRLLTMPSALDGTKITNLDFEEVVTAAGKDVFIFLDPPYFTAQRLYGRKGDLHSFDHARLADCQRNTSHRFLITYDDCPEIRKLYSWANIVPWQLQYGMNNCNSERLSKVGCELFVCNYQTDTRKTR